MQPVVVFDTNILLSRLGWKDTPYRCTKFAQHKVVPVFIRRFNTKT